MIQAPSELGDCGFEIRHPILHSALAVAFGDVARPEMETPASAGNPQPSQELVKVLRSCVLQKRHGAAVGDAVPHGKWGGLAGLGGPLGMLRTLDLICRHSDHASGNPGHIVRRMRASPRQTERTCAGDCLEIRRSC